MLAIEAKKRWRDEKGIEGVYFGGGDESSFGLKLPHIIIVFQFCSWDGRIHGVAESDEALTDIEEF